jgi:hypothetical protein
VYTGDHDVDKTKILENVEVGSRIQPIFDLD